MKNIILIFALFVGLISNAQVNRAIYKTGFAFEGKVYVHIVNNTFGDSGGDDIRGNYYYPGTLNGLGDRSNDLFWEGLGRFRGAGTLYVETSNGQTLYTHALGGNPSATLYEGYRSHEDDGGVNAIYEILDGRYILQDDLSLIAPILSSNFIVDRIREVIRATPGQPFYSWSVDNVDDFSQTGNVYSFFSQETGSIDDVSVTVSTPGFTETVVLSHFANLDEAINCGPSSVVEIDNAWRIHTTNSQWVATEDAVVFGNQRTRSYQLQDVAPIGVERISVVVTEEDGRIRNYGIHNTGFSHTSIDWNGQQYFCEIVAPELEEAGIQYRAWVANLPVYGDTWTQSGNTFTNSDIPGYQYVLRPGDEFSEPSLEVTGSGIGTEYVRESEYTDFHVAARRIIINGALSELRFSYSPL